LSKSKNVERQNVERQNVKRQNVERQNVERQNVEKNYCKCRIQLTPPDSPRKGKVVRSGWVREQFYIFEDDILNLDILSFDISGFGQKNRSIEIGK
jgi:hypothetical protein